MEEKKLMKQKEVKDPNEELARIQQEQQLVHQMAHLHYSSRGFENTLINGVSIQSLMQLEQIGAGDTTISQFLDAIQECVSEKPTEVFSAIRDRKKPVNPTKVELLIEEMSYYRILLDTIVNKFREKRKDSDYRLWAEAIDQRIKEIDEKYRSK